jgi:hypothetical protein
MIRHYKSKYIPSDKYPDTFEPAFVSALQGWFELNKTSEHSWTMCGECEQSDDVSTFLIEGPDSLHDLMQGLECCEVMPDE